MMNDLILAIGRNNIILRLSQDSGVKLSELAELLGLSVTPAASTVCADVLADTGNDSVCSDESPIFTTGPLAVFFNRKEQNFRLNFLYPLPELKLVHKIYIYQVMITFGVLSAMLRGIKLIPVHGALLDNGSEALLLCGESGVGKSTTARRWRESGGQCYADDLILIDYSGEEFFAHPLPTWSICKESLEGQFYPFNRKLPLKSVLGLSRGEVREYIAPISEDDFLAQLYRSAFFHILAIGGCLPEKEQKQLGNTVWSGVENLAAKFPPCGLFAHLKGDLKSTLGGYL